MITLGIILILVGLFVFHPLLIVGIILAVVGALLGVSGAAGHRVAGRSHWF